MSTETTHPTSAPERRPPAPPPLELLRRFVNTRNVEEATDRLDDVPGLVAWLEEEGFPRPDHISRADLNRVRAVREALRAVALANNERTRDLEAEATLDEAAHRAGLTIRFRDGGSVVEPEREGVDAAIGSMLAIVHGAMRDGTWSRFKACRCDECLWAFYDSSRNRGGHWCTMAVCGSRMKARAYRDRNAKSRPHRTGSSGSERGAAQRS